MEAYEQMTQEERDKFNALVARLDDMLRADRKTRERRQHEQPINFQERRIADRRKFTR